MKTIFDDLFLTPKEEKRRQLEILENKFIICQEQLLSQLRTKARDNLDIARISINSYQHYKQWLKGEDKK
jgi:hypothetical protein